MPSRRPSWPTWWPGATSKKELQVPNARDWKGDPDGLVFTTRFGTAQRRRYLNDALDQRIGRMTAQRVAAGLPALRRQWFHALRHQAATFQYAMDARDREVAEFLRHAPGSKVTARYIHLGMDYSRAAAERMDRLFPVVLAANVETRSRPGTGAYMRRGPDGTYATRRDGAQSQDRG